MSRFALPMALALLLPACGDDIQEYDAPPVNSGGEGGVVGGETGYESDDKGGSGADHGEGDDEGDAGEADGGGGGSGGTSSGGGNESGSGSGSGTSSGGNGADDGDTDGSGDDTDGSGDDTDGSGDDHGSDSEGDTGGPTCEPSTQEFELHGKPANVMLLLDKSTSMMTPWDHDGDDATAAVTRWQSLHDVVASVAPVFGIDVFVGAQLFPSFDGELNSAAYCEVASAPDVSLAPNNGEALVAGIPPADAVVSGGTPATAAVRSALDHLRSQDSDAPKFMVLVTDGAANCKAGSDANAVLSVYDDTLEPTVASAYADDGIITYVVGIDIVDQEIRTPRVNPHAALNAVADAGGAPRAGDERFYNAASQAELADALAQISGELQCAVTLAQPIQFGDDVTLSIDGQVIPRVDDCTTGDGWAFSSATAPFASVQLCGSACTSQPLTSTVKVDVACDPVLP